ncbi:PucR family transcriptional regulator [Kocuria tytonis]|uniref:PucR family transcriptional regulator n=1 Tax=Kocuria tytonis TaxID=2054280 RepID=A0A495A937_9MICC|nr:helix-turn-helix domain-containing protein [Kocuria tytonis]RKQ36571.1 PucR family transcriptional regulator [Kocuria tytonis]
MPTDASGSPPRKARSTRRVTWPLRSRQQGTPHPRTLEHLRANLGQVSTVAVQRLGTSLPWFDELRPDERSELGLLAQRGIASFVRWYENPQEPVWVLTEIFGQAPTELTRSITLQNALQVLRIVVDVVEEKVPELAQHNDEVALREAVLRFSREVAFAAADVYAKAAENRGSWDARLESLVVDGILRGDHSDSLRSRVSALGWTDQADVTVMVGRAPATTGPAGVERIRRAVERHAAECLVAIQTDRLVLVLGGLRDQTRSLGRLAAVFGDGPVVHGPPVDSVFEAKHSADRANAGLRAASAWPRAPRPTPSEDLWPERAVNGDPLALSAMVDAVWEPLSASSTGLVDTLTTYLSVGHSLEATARELFVHANTVRYRLRRVSDITGWDPLLPRDAFVLHCAILAGRLHRDA